MIFLRRYERINLITGSCKVDCLHSVSLSFFGGAYDLFWSWIASRFANESTYCFFRLAIRLNATSTCVFYRFLCIRIEINRILIRVFRRSFRRDIIVTLCLCLLGLDLLSLYAAMFTASTSSVVCRVISRGVRLFRVREFDRRNVNALTRSL